MSINKFTHQRVDELVRLAASERFESGSLTLLNFMEEIQKKLRGIQFGRISQRVYAYYPDELFARGYISYRDIRYIRSVPEKYTYNVSSPYIENNKTDKYNADRFFRMSSINIDTAVRNAVKYLRAYTPTDIVRVTVGLANDARDEVSHEERTDIRQLSSKICGSRAMEKNLRNELMHLYNAGHQFVDPEYGSAVAEYFTKHAAHTENEKTGVDFTFVLVKTVDGRHRFTCIDINRIRSVAYGGEEKLDANTHVTYELPDDVLSKVSVLTVGEDNTFLDGIGYKYCDEVYYVYK